MLGWVAQNESDTKYFVALYTKYEVLYEKENIHDNYTDLFTRFSSNVSGLTVSQTTTKTTTTKMR